MYVWTFNMSQEQSIHCLVAQWFASPACTELEAVVMDWAAKMFGLHGVFWNASEVGGGVIQVGSFYFRTPTSSSVFPLSTKTTASDSALTAVVVARSRYTREHPGTPLESLVIYVTTQTHSFGNKAGMILGLRVRALDVDVSVVADNTGLTGEGLRAAVEEDRAQGLHPFVLSEYAVVHDSRRLDKLAQSLLLELHRPAPLIGWLM
jgi:aromatic-L-amino-acid decarboxylase